MLSTLFGGGGQTTSGVGADLLSSWAAARAGIGVDVEALTRDRNAPVAEVWQPGISPSDESLIARALARKPFFDPSAKLFSDLGANGDYRSLFALYTGVSTLKALAGRASVADLPAAQKTATLAQFSRGLTELQAFFERQQFEDVRLAQGDRVDAAQSTLALPQKSEDYVTGVIHRGGLYTTMSGLSADAQFTISAKSSSGVVRNVAIDLAEMGPIARTFGAVISFINGKLSAAGVSSRLEASDQTPKTTKLVVAGQTIERKYTGSKLYALKIDVRGNETVSFSAPAATPAFYAVGETGKGAQLIKFSDVGDTAGEPQWLTRPGATADPIGAHIATGWFGPGAPYATAPTGAVEARSGTLLDTSDENSYETALREAGEATLKLDLGDGREISVSTGWRSDDLESWRARTGEDADRALMDDLAERLTQ
jgi:hypothetical protein